MRTIRFAQEWHWLHFAMRVRFWLDFGLWMRMNNINSNCWVNENAMSVYLQIGLIVMKFRMIFGTSVTAISSTNSSTWMPDSLCIKRSCCFNVRLAGTSAIPSKCTWMFAPSRYFSNASSTLDGRLNFDFPLKCSFKLLSLRYYRLRKIFTMSSLTYVHQRKCCNSNCSWQSRIQLIRMEWEPRHGQRF